MHRHFLKAFFEKQTPASHPAFLDHEDSRHHSRRDGRRPFIHDAEGGLRGQFFAFDRNFFGHCGDPIDVEKISPTALLDRHPFYQHSGHHDVRLYGSYVRAWLYEGHSHFNFYFGGYFFVLAL